MTQTTAPKTTGVLFVQLGTPDAPTPAAVRRYLAEFLSDRRVVDLPRLPWLLLLHGIILRTSPRHSAALYRRIWRSDGTSPLLYYTRKQTQAVGRRLAEEGLQVRFAMRYGHPSLTATLHEMVDSGVERLLIFPLFPQYSAATTASILDAVQAAMRRRRFVPTLRFAQPFFANPHYIDALAEQMRTHATPGESHTLFSFHGLPQRHVNEGDPYADQCHQTAHLLAKALNLPEDRWHHAFQSRFGREAWLTPATDHVLAQLPGKGCRRLTVVCPGFVTDCLETLEEINLRGKKCFMAAGGEAFHTPPCMNDASPWVEALAQMTRQELMGWVRGGA